jgi:large subunit ribosomal protein L15
MELHNLKFNTGAVKKSKRIGRGQGSGKGGTSTKGHKGAKARSGYKFRVGFEGGQMPLQLRVPKFGFKHYKKHVYRAVNLDIFQTLVEKHSVDTIDFDFLLKNKLVKKGERLKVLAEGGIKNKITIYAHAFSKAAKDAIVASGGEANVILC